MYTERFQILISPEQRARLLAEARARGESVAALVREAIDERFGGNPSRAERRAALERMTARSGDAPPPQELEELINGRFDEEHSAAAGRP